MMHTRLGAIGTNSGSVPGQETVRIQDPAGAQHMVLSNDMQFALPHLFLTNLKIMVPMSENITEAWGLAITLQRPQLRKNPPLSFKMCTFWHFISTPYRN